MIYRIALYFGRLPMQTTGWTLAVLIGFECFRPLHASPVATISSLNSPVWVQQNNLKSELTNNSRLNSGDHIITGDFGHIEINLEPDIALQVLANTEIKILAEKNAQTTIADNQSDLYVLTGRVCIALASSLDADNYIKIKVGNSLLVIAQHFGEFCVHRQDGLSSIELKSGSVQVKHSSSQDLVVLGEIGTEFRVEDDGSYDWGIQDSGGILTPENNEAAKDQAQVHSQSQEEMPQLQSENKITPSSELNITKVEGKDLAVDKENITAASYTVYLFSTRSEDVAKKANLKFRAAGYSTRIKAHETEAETRYRVVVSGFKSRQSAQEFASAIAGKLGVTDTWIGKKP